ncbi:MAG: hypothetical protein HY812_21905 [Planctomycetes bacterium]|nr:hypothetical protein [Planctomycetota bacterium]
MNRTTVAAAWTLLAASLPGQEPRIVHEEPASAAAQAPRRLFESTSCFQVEGPGGIGLEGAGRRESEELTGGRRRLALVLASGGAAAEEGLALGSVGCLERWLIRQVSERFDRLEAVEIVDRATSRTRGAAAAAHLERALEVTGEAAAVASAEEFLNAVLRQNRAFLLAELHLFRRPAGEESAEEPVTVAALSRSACETWLAERQQAQGDLLAAPRLMLLGGETAHVSVIDQMSYVRTYETRAVGEAVVVDPVVDVVQDGIIIQITPIIGPQGETISLGVDVRVRAVKRPIETVELEIPPERTKVLLQLPEVSTVCWSAENLELWRGEHGLLVTGLLADDWTEGGARRSFALELLMRLEVTRQEGAAPPVRVAAVLGFDATSCLVFARREGASAARLDPGTRVAFARGQETVGHGVVAEILGDVVLITLVDGEARAQDEAFLAQ